LTEKFDKSIIGNVMSGLGHQPFKPSFGGKVIVPGEYCCSVMSGFRHQRWC
jgi:hypothetical protein